MTHIVGISGSLRKESLNTKLLRVAGAMTPSFQELSIELPLYNGDLDPEAIPAVAEFKKAIGDADGVLIATPEYNYSIPGVLKNAIDWASRPGYQSVFAGKPVAIVGASMSPIGTARAQQHLKGTLLGMVAEVMPHPEYLLGAAHEKFDGDALEDEKSRTLLKELMEKFVSRCSASPRG